MKNSMEELRVRLLEKYFPFRNIVKRGRNSASVPIEEELTEKELEDFYWNVWRDVELMYFALSDSDMTKEAREGFLNMQYNEIWRGFQRHFEESQRQSDRAVKRHEPNRIAKERARELAKEYRQTNPRDRIGKAASCIEQILIKERLKSPSDRTIRGWIADLFPAESRKAGRPRS